MPQMLGQRVDPHQLFVGTRAVPVGTQLVLVLAGPLEDEPQGARRKPAVSQLECVDRDLGDVLAVARVEVGGGWSRKYIVITIP
jgi:hypothetical protein